MGEQEPLMIAVRNAARKGSMMDFQGLLAEMTPLMNAESDDKESIRRAWRILDEDRRGRISFDDVVATVRRLGLNLSNEELRDMMWHADTNNDGEVTFDEFYGVLSESGERSLVSGKTL